MDSLLDRLEEQLPAIIREFYDRLFEDPMIGFFFQGRDKDALIGLQLSFMGRVFGSPAPYLGRPLREAHAPLNIFDGQFRRRHTILGEVLARHGLAEEDRRAWLAADMALADKILAPQACEDAGH